MRQRTALLTTICATAALSMSACLIVVDEETQWSPPPTTCSYVCDDYGCWDVCYDIWCASNDECELGLYCEDDLGSYYYGQCVTSPAGLCSGDGSCDLDGYVCDDRDTCVPGEEVQPLVCEDFITEAECLSAEACAPVYAGLNCTTPSGAACTSEAADCTCESFAFARCEQPVTP